MLALPNFIAIGATNRNCGKTSYICGLLTRYSEHHPIAVKIKTIYPDDSKRHGTGSPLTGNFELREEKKKTGEKDSVRMLLAGAAKVYYLKTKIDSLKDGLEDLIKKLPDHRPIIVESNSLLEIARPAFFVMIKSANKADYKPSAIKFMHQADLVLETDGESHSLPPSDLPLVWSSQQWLRI